MVQSSLLDRGLFDRLSARFKAHYGRAWTYQFDEEKQRLMLVKDWRLILSGLSEAQLFRGMEKVFDGYLDHPPNSSQFRKLCLGEDGFNTAAYRQRKALPPPEFDREKADTEIAKCFQALGVQRRSKVSS